MPGWCRLAAGRRHFRIFLELPIGCRVDASAIPVGLVGGWVTAAGEGNCLGGRCSLAMYLRGRGRGGSGVVLYFLFVVTFFCFNVASASLVDRNSSFDPLGRAGNSLRRCGHESVAFFNAFLTENGQGMVFFFFFFFFFFFVGTLSM